ncbi:MAG: flavin reductase family protein [Saprospiraceae bacterium]|nr:flavin reductase family protein [Saprospiraceae bacterium]MCZ2336822.1 flavin reductase family protein [Chitinophagales bacterium]
MKKRIVPGELPISEMHQYMVGSVAPRPIAFVSTLNENGIPNLAPFSFFNVFSSNPPIVVFSANRRVSNNTTKDTLHNVRKTGECVINMVTHAIVRQASLASVEYASGINEFEKSGLTMELSETVKPPRVKESPVNMECVVKQIIDLGDQNGAGHLIICEVKRMFIDESMLDDGKIDPDRMDLMGRMGRAFYVRASGTAVTKIFQPFIATPIGFDHLPEHIVKSKILTGNEIAELAALNAIPLKEEVEIDPSVFEWDIEKRHQFASELLKAGKIKEAFVAVYY